MVAVERVAIVLGGIMRVGSLCTGIAGLELGLRLAGIDVEPVFVSDIDKGANEWLEANMPDTPNLGDFTALDSLPSVDLLTAGFPCQPLSHAGQRKGVNDERWLFDDICRLVDRGMDNRPLLYFENVPGLLTANDGDAMARVVQGLAHIGYSITWGTLPASAVGAPHRRLRWWGLAWHSEDVDQEWSVVGSGSEGRAPAPVGSTDRDDDAADAVRARLEGGLVAVTSQPEHDPPRLDRDASTDTGGDRDRISTGSRQAGRGPSSARAVGHRASAADTDDSNRIGRQEPARRTVAQLDLEADGGRDRRLDQFGPYAPAIERWQRVLGRAAPDPQIDDQLSAAFTEWLMGYPEGWVTGTLTSRRKSLHALGNAVVPQCAAAAFIQLVDRARTT